MNTKPSEHLLGKARAIAKEAYLYGFPMVDSYRIQYACFADPQNPDYKGPWNTLVTLPRVGRPDDKAVQSPDADAPCAMVGMDLRAEPLVLRVPPIERERYFSIQFTDAYTHNFAQVDNRDTGHEGRNFLVAGPGWIGDLPQHVQQLIRSETAVYRIGKE